jgi:ubiquinone/menaquinone biosynthesis C-methylase UbiE
MNDMSFSDPNKVLDQVLIRPGDTVVDIGAGLGAYTFLAADRVGADGAVYAIEVQLSHVDGLKDMAGKDAIENLHVLWADAELPNGTKLRDEVGDMVILTNVLFTIEDKSGLVKEIYRILKPGGKILLVDWSESFGGIGPHPQNLVPEKMARNMFIENGFDFEKSISAGSHHYGMILTKK